MSFTESRPFERRVARRRLLARRQYCKRGVFPVSLRPFCQPIQNLLRIKIATIRLWDPQFIRKKIEVVSETRGLSAQLVILVIEMISGWCSCYLFKQLVKGDETILERCDLPTPFTILLPLTN